MELIIIPALTTIALIAMQAVEFIRLRQPRVWTAPVQAPDALQILESAPVMPAAHARVVHTEQPSGEQRAA